MVALHKLDRDARTTSIQALVVVSIITVVHFFFFRDLMMLAVVAITVALLGARASFRQSVATTLKICIVFTISSLVSILISFLFRNDFLGYVLAIFTAGMLTAIFTKGHYVALTLVMVNVMFFVILPRGAGWAIRLVPLLILAEVLFGAAVTLLVVRLTPARHRIQPVEADPPVSEQREKTPHLPLYTRIASFFKTLDIRVYKAIVAAALSYLVYMLLDWKLEILYPAFIFNATFLVATTGKEQTLRSGRNMILGLLVGIGVGFAAFMLFSQIPNYYLAIPFVVVLIVLLDRLLFGRLEPGSVIVAFLLMLDMSGGHPYRFIVDRILFALIGIAVAVAVDYAFLFGRKRLQQKTESPS